jgi:septal ring factor EnvC (AmiA/AmiB activator)
MNDAPGRSGSTDEKARARIRQLEDDLATLAEQAAQIERELRSAKADVSVKDEYISALENELKGESGSRPHLRPKAWLARWWRRSGTSR